MNLRHILLTGVVLCILARTAITIRHSGLSASAFERPSFLAIMALILAWNAYAAIRWTHARTSEDSMVLRAGVKWGLAKILATMNAGELPS